MENGTEDLAFKIGDTIDADQHRRNEMAVLQRIKLEQDAPRRAGVLHICADLLLRLRVNQGAYIRVQGPRRIHAEFVHGPD